MYARVSQIEYWLPERTETNRDLKESFPDWDIDKIVEKTGIETRHIAHSNECASDLGYKAALRLFRSTPCLPSEIDFLIFCTQSPDYFLPTTACILQERLGIPTVAGALDINLGCSGYIYSLGIAQGLIESSQAKHVLLITADTYSKYINPGDRSVRLLFGDAGAATLIRAQDDGPAIGPFVYGTDGSGAKNLIVPVGGMRERPNSNNFQDGSGEHGNIRSAQNLYMNGPEIFTFTLRAVPDCVESLLKKSGMLLESVDKFIFHQANRFMLLHLQQRLKIPDNKFIVALSEVGNTVSSSIPIALKTALDAGRIRSGETIMLVGFGVGYSWGATLLKW
jgi:3-oxoacyl-[acyl-carrier-protein] synthase III